MFNLLTVLTSNVIRKTVPFLLFVISLLQIMMEFVEAEFVLESLDNLS